MTNLVLDAAAAVEICLRTPAGLSLSTRLPPHAETHVPEHFYVEVAAALRRMELAGATPSERAGLGFRRLLALPCTRVQVRHLLPNAWSLRHNLTIADGVYVVLTRALDATLVTGDQRLSRAPKLGIRIIT